MELPSKKQIDELFKEIEDVLKEPDYNWKEIGAESTFRVARKKHKKHSIRLGKVTGVLQVPVEQVVELFDNLAIRKLWDPLCKSATVVRKNTEVQIHHMELAPFPLLSSRDMVYYTSHRISDRVYTGVSKSLPNSSKLLPPAKGVVRMEIVLSGTKLEPIIVDGKECTKVTFLGLTDPKGLVPSINLKAVVMKSASLMCYMRDYLYKKNDIPIPS
eukprot:Phypoly_transcript_17027.p1 GENE.Phypoly_transcript_17027~~Phypoly_transcript_17027.p1  ORF type:complete len:215 (+),score=23.42 Phypoly_transcript_17027:158-802(+)